MTQTTSQTAYIEKLLAKLDHERATNKYLRHKVDDLEEILGFRHTKTKSHYERLKPYLESVRAKAFIIFLELPKGRWLKHEEIITKFHEKYPDIPTKNLPRRVRELVTIEGKLLSRQDEYGLAEFALKLLP